MSQSQEESKLQGKTNTNKPARDPLLACLIWFTQYFNRPHSEKSLIAGLPLENNQLTPAFFARASQRAHLTSHIQPAQSLLKIAKTAFPVILLLKDNKPVVLLKVENQTAFILSPEFDMGMTEISIENLEKNSDQTIIIVKPAYEFSRRSHEDAGFGAKNLEPEINTQNWFWNVIVKVWPLYTEALTGSLLINLFALAVPLFVMNVYDRVVPNQSIETLWVLAIGVGVVFAFDFGMRLLRSYFIDVAGKSVDTRLSAQIFEQILGVRMQARPASVGAFANTISSFESFRDFITSSTVTVLVDLPFVFIFIGIVAMIGGSLAWVPLIMVPLIIFLGWIIQIPLTNLTKISYQYANEKQAALIETLAGVETIKSISAESNMQKRWEQVNKLSAQSGIKLRFFSNLNVYLSVFAQQFAYIFVIIWGVYKIGLGELTTGGLIACSILTSRALAPMSQIAALLTKYYQTRLSLEAINSVMKMPVERPRGQTFIHRPKLQGAIEFRQVGFSYPDQPLPALKNVSFKIAPGERVGIIGRMGSGKTTIAKLILGLYQPSAGLVLLDDVDQNQIDMAELRHNVGYVSQDVMLFYGSVKDNIAFGAPYVEDELILNAAKVGCVESFTRNHPEGLGRQVGERGVHLSGGQRQCIAFARAALLDPPVMILDEATNSVDDKTESLLKSTLEPFLENKTLVMITHKSSVLTLVSRIIIIDNGQVIADGPKEDVLKALSENKIRGARL
jgi:ATP-binding cassette subfamily C protein LapB